MESNRRLPHVVFALVMLLGLFLQPSAMLAGNDTLPARLTDQDFWRMTEELSEPEGYFRSDNLLSNERWMQYVIPELLRDTKPGGVYLGVGPEQNFTYIAVLKPKMAFITDIRRGNMHTQLMYKALFELSADRADFVARLFSRKRPAGLDSKATAESIFTAYAKAKNGDATAYNENLKAIDDLLVKKHGFPLSPGDLADIGKIYNTFYRYGPDLNYTSSGNSFGARGYFVTYADLMMETDEEGVNHSYLASENNFKVVKEMEEKNLIIPLVGDFAGDKAIRAVGKYLKEHNATVMAFYLSNVEQYLRGRWNSFCANVAALPLDENSTFIRASRNFGGSFRYGLETSLGPMQSETKICSDR
jgi:hypothetical protein